MLLWIGIILISLGLLGIIMEWVYVFARKDKESGFSFTPFIYGLMLFTGVLLLPIELPIPKLLAAFLAMCLDATISVMFPMFLFIELRDRLHKKDQDS